MESILNTVKDVIGIDHENTDFDPVLILDTNSVFMILNQMGIGPDEPFEITGALETWPEFVQDIFNINSVKTYVGLKVKEMFDPPSSSVLGQSLKARIDELEYRLMTQCSYNRRTQQ